MADREFIGGVTNTVIYTETDGTMHIEETQDAEPIMHYAQAARDHRFSAAAVDGMFQHEAEIPFTVFQKECQKRGIVPLADSQADALVIEAILADPQYAAFRAAPKLRDPHVVIRGAR